MDFKEQLSADTACIETRLKDIFSGEPPRGDIYPAMEYSLLAGGKRLRPVLTLECCRICGGDPEGKLHLLMDFTTCPGDVADPWYTRDFDATWRDVLEGCTALLKQF